MTRATLALVLSIAGCTETIRLDHDPLDNLLELDIVPADAMVELTDLAPPHHTLQYAAVGHFSDGTARDITDVVTWAIDRDILGELDDHGLFTASHAAAGHATVAARVRGLQATGALQITIDATITDATFPPPAANIFAPSRTVITTDPTHTPKLVYPSDGTYLPNVIASTLFQLDTGVGNDAYRISFDNDVLHLRVETGADRWRADGDIERLLAMSAGPDPMRVSVDAAVSTGTAIYAGAPIALAFSADLGDTPLYFWSAATNGIMRGGVDLPSASKLYPSGGTCVGCHAVSRDGRALALGVDAGSATTFQLEALDLDTQQPKIPASPARLMGWAAYSPDGSRLVVANDGVLTQYDPQTGVSLGVVPLPSMHFATHPDWSPDGRALAVAYAAQSPTNLDVKAASIALLPYTNGTWGPPQVIVPAAGPTNNYFPRWSPDGSMLAFVRATASSRGALSAELMLIAATGGTPQALAIASHRAAGVDVPDLANTMPSWAPRVGARQWLAFASARAYGKVVTSASQIWITSLDLAAPGDPTTPAFWLPCQDVNVLNNTPVWAPSELVTQ